MFVCRVTKGADEGMLPDSGHKFEYRLEKDVNQVYRNIQRLLSAYKDENNGPTYIAVQSSYGNWLQDLTLSCIQKSTVFSMSLVVLPPFQSL